VCSKAHAILILFCFLLKDLINFDVSLVLEEKSKTASSSSISVLANNQEDDDDENATTRFVSRLLNWLLQGFTAKNKNVRYRCTHIVSEMISHLGEIEQVV
jgi:condensin complex subunit 3